MDSFFNNTVASSSSAIDIYRLAALQQVELHPLNSTINSVSEGQQFNFSLNNIERSMPNWLNYDVRFSFSEASSVALPVNEGGQQPPSFSPSFNSNMTCAYQPNSPSVGNASSFVSRSSQASYQVRFDFENQVEEELDLSIESSPPSSPLIDVVNLSFDDEQPINLGEVTVRPNAMSVTSRSSELEEPIDVVNDSLDLTFVSRQFARPEQIFVEDRSPLDLTRSPRESVVDTINQLLELEDTAPSVQLPINLLRRLLEIKYSPVPLLDDLAADYQLGCLMRSRQQLSSRMLVLLELFELTKEFWTDHQMSFFFGRVNCYYLALFS